MYVERYVVPITTDGSGNADVYTPAVTGRILAVIYQRPVTNPLDTTADITVTAEATGEPIVTITNASASAAYYPRPQVHDAAGAGRTYNGTQTVGEPVAVANDRIRIQVAQGGASKLGTVQIVVG